MISLNGKSTSLSNEKYIGYTNCKNAFLVEMKILLNQSSWLVISIHLV